MDFLSYWTNLIMYFVNISIPQELLGFSLKIRHFETFSETLTDLESVLNPIHVGINSWYFYRESNLTISIINGVKNIQRQVKQ